MKAIKRVFKKIKYKAEKAIYNLFWLFRKKGEGKNILLATSYEAYDPHILNYYNCIKDQGYNVFLLYYSGVYDHKTCVEKAQTIVEGTDIVDLTLYATSKKIYFKHFFDLIVMPDHNMVPRVLCGTTKTLFIYHGTSTRLVDGELYAYKKNYIYDEEGRCKYNKMLENNKLLVQQMQQIPALKDVVEYTSSADADLIAQNLDKQDYYKQKLGFKKEDKVVFIYSTWNKESLFQSLGREFIASLKDIQGENIKLILSAHPREYTKYDPNLDPLGEFIDEQQQYGICVRKPGQPWLDYIIASDVVVGDHSTLLDFAVMAKKKLIMCELEMEKISPLSPVAQAYSVVPKVKKQDDFGEILNEVLEKEIQPQILEISENICAEQGFYKKRVCEITQQLLDEKRSKR